MFPQLDRGYTAAAAVTIVAFGLGITLICGFFRRNIWSRLNWLLNLPGGRIGAIALVIALLGTLAVLIVKIALKIPDFWLRLAHKLTDDDQPMVLLDGLSIWPTIGLRAATLVLCVFLFIHAFRWLNKDFDRVASGMEVTDFWDRIEEAERARQDRPWTKFVHYFSYPMPDGTSSDYKQRFWSRYIYQATWPARICRTVVAVIALFVLWGILELVFGNPPAPTRGPVSFWFYTGVSLLLNITALFLILFVADATLLYRQVIKALVQETDNRPNVWPEDTQRKFGGRVGLPNVDLEHWIDLVFITKRTKCVTTLIYFPFIIVALVIISRSRLFANYAPSLPEILVMALALLIVAVSAIALRQAAEASRAKAHRRLNDQIMLSKRSSGGERRAAQLELLSHRVEELHDGALTPFSQQPLLRAMLLPLGSFGGTALVEYLLLPGFS
jgi:cbb3-type cytochrome oxidase subunit 3